MASPKTTFLPFHEPCRASFATDIEQGRALWPQQVVTGHIHALEKLPGAWKASQYRPLTVFSIVYRTWSPIRARETLAYLSQFVPEHKSRATSQASRALTCG